MADVLTGAIEYPNPDVIINVDVDAAVSTAGTVRTGAVIPFPDLANKVGFGVVAEYTRDLATGTIIATVADGTNIPLGVNGYFRVRKVTGGGTAIAYMDKVSFAAASAPNEDEYEAKKAATKEVVYAYCMEAAADGDATVLIWGPIWPPPFETIP